MSQGIRRKNCAPATVFVADDDATVRQALRLVLEDEGYEVLEASDGADALTLLAGAADGDRTLPDVVVLDVTMPGFSGLGILRALQRFPKAPPTLVITGFGDSSVEALARRLGALRVFHKPLDLDEVRTAVLEAALR